MKARCFVIQGFGKKTDYTDGRVLDLDASYEVIKEAVTSCGVECIRADEILHSGTIDKPMYEQLLGAELVIADLSTYNLNAAFELAGKGKGRSFLKCFLDTKSIPVGHKFQPIIRSALEQADWLIAVFTDHQSVYCGYEIGIYSVVKRMTIRPSIRSLSSAFTMSPGASYQE